MKDMRLLRVTAIFSNVAFVIYGAMQHLLPALVLRVNAGITLRSHRPSTLLPTGKCRSSVAT